MSDIEIIVREINNLLEKIWDFKDESILPNLLILPLSGRKLKKKRALKKAVKKLGRIKYK